MEKKELQKYVNKLILMADYAESDGQLLKLNEEEVEALKAAAVVMQEKCDSMMTATDKTIRSENTMKKIGLYLDGMLMAEYPLTAEGYLKALNEARFAWEETELYHEVKIVG